MRERGREGGIEREEERGCFWQAKCLELSLSLFPATTPSDKSPPSLTLRIPKDHIRGLSGGKTGQFSSSAQSSLRVQLRTKVTRSKAWLQEYVSSNEPLKMYLAAVYEHTDPTGVCVAEVFHELPSAKVR